MSKLLLVDTWAWLALALRRDQHHDAARAQHALHLQDGRRYVTTDYVLAELVTQLYRSVSTASAEKFFSAILVAIENSEYQLERISPQRFDEAWTLRRQYVDKPSISFVDFTSFTVMKDLKISEVFTVDAHFKNVNLGFQLVP